MKIKRKIAIFIVLLACFVTFGYNNVYAEGEKLYLGGIPAGFSLYTRGACVVGLCDVITENGISSPSKNADIRVGDLILSIDGLEVNSAADIENSVKNELIKDISLDRNGEIVTTELVPAKDMSGKYKLGVFIRDCVNGIGTITYIKGDKFASLGHPVINEDGSILKIMKGKLYSCSITGVVKGERGKAGELRGVFQRGAVIAEIEKNNLKGVYGSIYGSEIDYDSLKEISTGEAKVGNAVIYSTINGSEPEEYSISIIKVDGNNKDNKNFVIKITDKTLLSLTGGIVQGMSGSPIVQDGKLVGAITHVFINDPSRGFGISIDNMLNN